MDQLTLLIEVGKDFAKKPNTILTILITLGFSYIAKGDLLKTIQWTLATLFLLNLLFEFFLWKVINFAPKKPVISGTWEGRINSEFKRKEKRVKKKCNVTIKQTWSKTLMYIKTNEMQSKIFNPTWIEFNGESCLFYHYKTNTNTEKKIDNPDQMGWGRLRKIDSDTLRIDYSSDYTTKGHIILKRKKND